MLLNQETLATPIGEFQLLTDSEGRVVALEWTDLTERYENLLKRQYPGVVFQIQPAKQETDACRSLKNYFNGDLNALAEIRVHHGGTEFQREVWSALREIPRRRNGQLRRFGGPDRTSRGSACRRPGERRKSDRDNHAVPPRNRQGWNGSPVMAADWSENAGC